MKAIAISGHARNGKDTAGLIIESELTQRGFKVLVTHYADLVKYVCRSFLLWDGEKDEKGRSLLQMVGTDIVRKNNENYWVDFIGYMVTTINIWDYVIIPDARFPNEISRLKDRWGIDVEHWRIVRPAFDNQMTAEQNAHTSEVSLDNVRPDVYILNSGSFEDLRECVKKQLGEMLYGQK